LQTMLDFLHLLREQHGSSIDFLQTHGASHDELARFSSSLLNA